MKGENAKMSDTEVTLKATLDASGIKNDVAKIQKTLDKQTVSLPAEIDAQKLLKSVKTVLPKVIKELQKIPEIEVPVNAVVNEKSVNSAEAYKKVLSDVLDLQSAKNVISESKTLAAALEEVLKVWNRFKNGFSIGGIVEFGLIEALDKISSESSKLKTSDIAGLGAGVGIAGLSAFIKNFD